MASRTNAPDTQTNAETDATTFICPVVGAFSIDASASLISLQQLAVTLPYDDKFNVELDATLSDNLIKSFVLSGAGSTFQVAMAAGATNKLHSVLEHVINNAEYAPKAGSDDVDNSGNTLGEVLSADMEKTFRITILDTLPNILQSGDNFGYSVDASGGASSMNGLLSADAGAREIIAQQLPEANYTAWADASENAVSPYPLPLLDGQTLVFIFDVTGKTVVRLEGKSGGLTADAGSGVTEVAKGAGQPTNPYSADKGATEGAKYIYSNRKVAFFVKVSGINNAMPEDAVGV